MDRFLKYIDIVAYIPLIILIRLLSYCINRKTDSDQILVIRPGGMGDLICLTMALEDMKVAPDRVVFLIQKRSEPWAKHLKLKYMKIGFNRTFFKNIFNFQAIINTEQLFGLSQALAVIFSRHNGSITGFNSCRGSFINTRSAPYDPIYIHEVICFRRLLSCSLSLDKTPTELEQIHPRVRHLPNGPQHLIVGIAGLQAPSRSLPIDTWVQIIERWALDRPLLFVGAPIDTPFIDAILTRKGSQNWAHYKGNFSEVVRLIREATRFLTIDGGLVHVASFYGTPTDAIFTSGQYKKWAPLSEGSNIIKNWNVPCSPCTLFGQVPKCPHSYRCKRDLKF